MIFSKSLHGHRPPLNPTPYSQLLTPSSDDPRQPKPHNARTPFATTNIHLLTNLASILPHPSLRGNGSFYILRNIRGHPDPYPRAYYPLREPSRTTQCGDLLLILHTRRLPPPTHCTSPSSKRDRHPLTPNPAIQQAPPPDNLKQQSLMGRVSYCLPGKNTTIRCPLMTP